MKLLCTASRKLTDEDYAMVAAILDTLGSNITQLWTGGAKGGDQLCKRWARETGMPYYEIKPDYEKHERNWAPLERNLRLIKHTDCTLALYNTKLQGGTAYTASKSVAAGHWTSAYNLQTGECQHWHEPNLL